MKPYRKMASRRFWLTVWCALLCSYIVAVNRIDFAGLALILAGIVGGYIGVESYLKKTLPKE